MTGAELDLLGGSGDAATHAVGEAMLATGECRDAAGIAGFSAHD